MIFKSIFKTRLYLRFEELGESFQSAVARVVDDPVGAGGEELDGGERLDLHVFNLEKFEKLFNAS